MLLIDFQRSLDVFSCLFIGNASGDILTYLVVGTAGMHLSVQL